MKTFYLLEFQKLLPNYKKEYELVKEFYRFLEALEKGGLYSDITKRGQLSMGRTKARRLEHRFPRLVTIATLIPEDPPRRGHRWIVLEVKNGQPQRFIQVPLSIRSVNDIAGVLDQLVPLKSKKMKTWLQRFGSIPRLTAFMYLLATLVSDGFFTRRNGASTALGISLSTKYPWSESFGEMFCYCLGLFGFKAGRIKNSVSKNKAGEEIENMNWLSSASPFFLWIRNSLLGLSIDRKKSGQPIGSEWILGFPKELLIPFIQGIADGDGFASIRRLHAGISTKHNKEFIRHVLRILGIESMEYSNGLMISKKRAIEAAARIPIFRNSDGRLNRLRELHRMLSSIRRTRVSSSELEAFMKLHEQGLNSGEIVATLWAENGIIRRPKTIDDAIKRELKRMRISKAED
jgi:hypothetical protein